MDTDRFSQAVPSDVSNEAVNPVDERYVDDPKSNELSSEFVGRWSTLISTTNWEKGRIIFEWREALMGSEAPVAAYSDEAWTRRVGGVTPQHVGRLRRVFERFHDIHKTFENVYWSHFLAALDWEDAELWLEGAVQSKWSVSQMRRTRWESSGGDPANEPRESEVTSHAEDEDYTPLGELDDDTGVKDGSRGVSEGPRPDGPDFGDEAEISGPSSQVDDDLMPWEDDQPASHDSPFATLPSLPVDVAEALEQFKLAIIRHRSQAWADVAQEDVIRALEALRLFASL